MISMKVENEKLVFTAESGEGLKLMHDLIELWYLPMPDDCWLRYVDRLSPSDPVYLLQAVNYGLQKLGAFSDDEDAMSAGDRFTESLMRKADEVVGDIKGVNFRKSDIDSLIWWSR